MRHTDLTGQTIGGYLVAGFCEWRQDGARRRSYWRFRCPCGQEFSAMAPQVRDGSRTCKQCRVHPDFVDLTGKQFGKLTVLRRFGSRGTSPLWETQCSGCQKTFVRVAQNLKAIKRCPCYRRKVHGEAGTSTWRTWRCMLDRCKYPSTPKFEHYGGRGIKVCERWHVYENFLADMGRRPPGTTIDRRDNDGNYEPGNCRWATKNEQRRNMDENHKITFRGETRTMAEWAEITGIPRERIRHRYVRAGWSPEATLGTPKQKGGRPRTSA